MVEKISYDEKNIRSSKGDPNFSIGRFFSTFMRKIVNSFLKLPETTRRALYCCIYKKKKLFYP